MGMCKWFLKMLPKFEMAARSQLNFFVGAKTLQISQKLFTFHNHFPHDMEMCRYIFKGFAEIQNGSNGSPSIFCGRKNSKTLSQKLFKFYHLIPHDMEMCRWFFKV